MKHCFVCVCERGDLEIESVILSASFLFNYTGDYEFIACAPEGEDAPDANTIKILEGFGVRIEKLENKYLAGKRRSRGLLMTNKFPCLRVKTKAPWITYLDADQILRRRYEMPSFPDVQFAGRHIGYPGALAAGDKWSDIFACVGLELPTLRLRLRNNDGVPLLIPPFFNGGLAILDARVAGRYVDDWESCWLSLVENSQWLFPREPVHWERYEQLALGLAVHRLALKYELFGLYDLYHYNNANNIGGTDDQLLIKKIVERFPKILSVPHSKRWQAFLEKVCK